MAGSSDAREPKKLVKVFTKILDETVKPSLLDLLPNQDKSSNFIEDFKNSLGQSKSLSEVQDLCTKFLEALSAYGDTCSRSASVLSDKWRKAAKNELNYVIFFQKSGNEELLIIKQTAQHKEDKDMTRQSQVQNESQQLNHDSKIQLENEDVNKCKSINLTLNDLNGEVFLDQLYMRKRSENKIGHGANKVVYRAENIQTKEEVAWCELKIENELNDEKFITEVSILKDLNHANVLRMLYYKQCIRQSDQTSTLVMITELMTGGDLRSYIKSIKPGISDICNWGHQILNGLSYLHSQKPPVIHRDLKCTNIFIDRETLSIKIGDFGVATVLESSMCLTIGVGTPYYVAPEMFKSSDYKEPVDIYSFGLCLLEMYTQEYPYVECKTPNEIMCKKLVEKDPPAAFFEVNNDTLKCIIEKCIQYDPAERPTAKHLLEKEFFKISTENLDDISPVDVN